MLGRLMLSVGLLATGLFAWAGLQGRGDLQVEEVLSLHVLLSLGAVLALVLCHNWVLFYLYGTGRLLAEAEASEASEAPGAPRTGVLALLWAPLLALGSALAVFGLGVAAYAGWSLGEVHRWVAWGTLGVQLVCLFWELRLLEATERRLGRAEALEVRAMQGRAMGGKAAPGEDGGPVAGATR